jgi:hypothetical protein
MEKLFLSVWLRLPDPEFFQRAKPPRRQRDCFGKAVGYAEWGGSLIEKSPRLIKEGVTRLNV